ncbi:MAG: SDR family oxidoreductase [Candidatus Aminicenantes bacterium]|nr:SDR family oxidoreductase [Candidatus Aminicenantes bacterium]
MGQEANNFLCTDMPTTPRPGMGRILVSGASGYIGGRLTPELLARGYSVRVMVRADSPEYKERWPGAEIHVVDALDKEGLKKAMEGVYAAYYLIHSMLLGTKKFESADIQAARNFREAAEENNVGRIIYLGGLGDINTRLSPHLRSRMQVAAELRKGRTPVTVLRAAVIIGSGSASFEIIKNLVKAFPVLPCPTWTRTQCQPIAIRDVIKYLVGVLETDETTGKSFDIGGTEILNYQKMMQILAQVLGKRMIVVPLPFSITRIYAYVTSFFTPVPARITMCLMEGCKNEVICKNRDIHEVLSFQLLPYKEAIARAITREEQDRIHTRWSDAYPPAHELAIKLRELPQPPRYTTRYSLLTSKDSAPLFQSICRIGGKHGWFNSNLLWRLRGMIDRMFMGVGTSRGRRSYSDLRINDVIDFWRVEDLKPKEMLLLRAEMILPGKAWLKFEIDSPEGKDLRRLSVEAFFDTRGLFGKIYWYMFMPFHRFIFYDIINQIEKRSQ